MEQGMAPRTDLASRPRGKAHPANTKERHMGKGDNRNRDDKKKKKPKQDAKKPDDKSAQKR